MPIRIYIVIFLLSFVGLLVLYGIQYTHFYDHLFHLVSCDVGQGDGTFIRTPEGKNILVDGGPDSSILSCLSSHMPFWERKIDLVLLTHPHQDHFVGLFDVFDRYTVGSFATEQLNNPTKSFASFIEKVKEEGISWQKLTSGDTFKTASGVKISVLGPSKEYLSQTSPHGDIGEKQEFASLIVLVSYGSFDILLDGDSQSNGIEQALSISGPVNLEVLQLPHHGSKTGLDQTILKLLHPKLAFVSVGRKNRYGHPAIESLQLLKEEGIPVLRTDQMGTIEFISDGKKWGWNRVAE